ncbi:alpha-L-rhamnosidase [Enterococcus sp. JM4C]|nr:alpha-L-rhamnosidase [Enterococcus sp. JM4C]
MLAIQNLLCDYRNNPIGIDTKKPTFSWEIISDKVNVYQEQFNIQVSLTQTFNQIIWNKKTFSDNSINVTYEGPSLESFKKYYYRVKIWTNLEEASEWSDTGSFEMGILDTNLWMADWITPERRDIELDFGTRQPFSCYKDFILNTKIKKAIVYVSSLGLYELALNGKKVGDDYLTPGWTDYNNCIQYQTYDVTDYISEQNRIEAVISEGWYSGYLGWQKGKDSYGNTNALIAQLHLYYIDGTSEIIGTDNKWMEQTTTIKMADIYNGSICDFQTKIQDKKNMVSYAFPKDGLTAQQNEPVKKIEEIRPKKLFKTPNGEVVLDMGQNMVGWVKIKNSPKLKTTLKLTHAEVLDKEGNFYIGNLRHAAQQSIYYGTEKTLEDLEPHFTFYGFRYVRLEGFPEDIDISWFKGIVVHSAMEEIGLFETSNPQINQLQSNIRWGQKGNFVDVPTDCPQRDERLGWTADAQVFSRTASYIMNTNLFFRKWLADMRFNQMEDGSIPLVVPDVIKGQYFLTEEGNKVLKTASAWGDAIIICPWMVFLTYGDTRILEDNYEAMKKWINFILIQGEEPYLWDSSVQLGDWLALDHKEDSLFGATDESLVATAFYAYSADILSKIAKLLYKYDDFCYYSELFEKIKMRFQEVFIQNGELVSQTQTAHILALYFELVPEQSKVQFSNTLVELIQKKNNHLDTGFVGTPYICHVLSENNCHELALKLLHNNDYPSWLYQIERGATTMWEHWDGIKEDGTFWSDSMNSFNHYSYGAVGDWMYKYIGGISIDEAGFKKSRIAPVISKDFSYVKSSIKTMYGLLGCSWKTNGNQVSMEVQVPHNTSSTIRIKSVENTDSVISVIRSNYEVMDLSVQEDDIYITVGSGLYRFEYTINKL